MAAIIGIISIGEMGLGIGQLLLAHEYKVVTFAEDRSEGTRNRAKTAGIELLPSVAELLKRCDYILSIVPPRDAFIIADRIVNAQRTAGEERQNPLYFVDLNAISPASARDIEKLFNSNPTLNFHLVDGGIIGGVPYPKSSPDSPSANGSAPTWHCPSLIVSGPDKIPDSRLTQVLNIQHIAETIGPATGLKMCFAVTTKGFVSLAIESFVTAHKLGVLPELQHYMREYNPATLTLAEKGLVTMPPKAYRWVHEMREIAKTMADDGGFEPTIFEGVSDVYQTVADNPVLGKEQPGARNRGKDVEDVVSLLAQGGDAGKK